MRDHIFDNHAAFNHYQSILGMRPSENYTKPSVSISIGKLRRGFKTLTDAEISKLFGKKLAILGFKKYREILDDKLSDVMDWQLFNALYILMKDGNEDAAAFLIKCRYDDVCPFEDEHELYILISRL